MQANIPYISEKYKTEKKRLYLTGKQASSYWARQLLGCLMGCFCAMCHPFLFWHLMKQVTWHKPLGDDINCGFIACVNKGVSVFKHCPKITFLNLTVEIFPGYML